MESDASDLPIVKKPRLRWFQFRLRTMFVVTTLFALWFGNEMNFIHRRVAILEQVEAAGGFVDDADIGWRFFGEDLVRSPPHPVGDRVAAFRLWLGDRARDTIYLPHDFSEADEKRVVELFPDTQIGRESKIWQRLALIAPPLRLDPNRIPVGN